jgi:ABC-type uncharacterized transport system ATPase subunit
MSAGNSAAAPREAAVATPAISVRMQGIVKRYPGVVAVDGVDFECRRGEIHALAGENGAGKSTLMKVLYGLTRPDAGTMALDGVLFAPAGPREALARGVGMVHQHFMLIPTFTALENAMLGEEPLRAHLALDRDRCRRRLEETAERYGLDVAPDAKVEELSVGEKQRLEILKVLLRGARILVLDEPTAVLVPTEVRALFRTLRKLAAEGASIVFITHKLEEVVRGADRVTVMRRGRVVGTRPAAETDKTTLVRMMVGRDPAPRDPTPRRAPGEVSLRLRGVGEVPRRREAAARQRSVDLDVRAGEIVGIAGVEGNGQRELVEIVAGLRPYRGTAVVLGRDLVGLDAAALRRLGLAHVPEDRLLAGLIPSMTVAENLVLGKQWERRFRSGLGFAPRAIRDYARERIAAFDVRPPSPALRGEALSGGNQQKLVIAREAEGDPAFLLAAHPTRGVDVGAQEAIHAKLLELRERGTAVLLVSADLSEILHLSDRVLVLYAGRIAGEFARGEADEERLGTLMIGGAEPRREEP